MEEVDPVLDVVLDQHPLGVAADEVAGRTGQLVGQQQGGFLMPQVGDGQLAERAVVALQRNPAIQDAWRLIDAGNALELDPLPSRYWGSGDLLDELPRPSPERDEPDPHLVQLVELGVGRQFGVEDEF